MQPLRKTVIFRRYLKGWQQLILTCNSIVRTQPQTTGETQMIFNNHHFTIRFSKLEALTELFDQMPLLDIGKLEGMI